MTDSEKCAVWMLGVVALTTAAYFILFALRGDGPAATKVFALLALIAVPGIRWLFTGRRFDEREKSIAHKALLTAFRAMWVVVVGLFVIMMHGKGLNATLSVPIWKLAAALWFFGMLMLAVQSVATLVLYRRGSGA